jgi:hypothetical protein
VQERFTYFSDIEEHFCRRRGTALICSTLDWALMETWKNADIPIEAVLRGIDAAFDRYHARPSKTRKINSLAYCTQEVLAAAEDIQEAAVGATRSEPPDTGLGSSDIASYLERNAAELQGLLTSRDAADGYRLPPAACPLVEEAARTLRDLAGGLRGTQTTPLEDLERRLTVMEEKLTAVLLAATSDDELVTVRAEADRELAPYRRKMSGAQIEQLMKQYIHKRLLERYRIPRLSLFYM